MTCSIACQREWPVLNQLSGYRRRVWSKECRAYLAPPIIIMGDGWNLAQFLTFPPFHVIDPPCPVLFALLYPPVAVVQKVQGMVDLLREMVEMLETAPG